MEPTNRDLLTAFQAHAAEDATVHREDLVFQVEAAKVHKQIFDKIDALATKEDIAQINKNQTEMMEFMKNINIGIGVFKFSWNNAAKIGSFLFLLVGVYYFFKFGIIGGIMYVIGKTP